MTTTHELPPDRRPVYDRARRLAWWTIAYLVSVGVVLYLVLGPSQAMKAAWLETVFSIATPVLFLVSGPVSGRPADDLFPFGYHRWVSIAFLCAALALFGLGIYLVADAIGKLTGNGQAAEIGTVTVFGHVIWLGWPMLAALAWSAVPAWFIGRRQYPCARLLHDKVLSTDAKMREADWLTASAAAVAVFGFSAGMPWLDPVAAGAIALNVLWSGVRQLRHAVADLADSTPATVDGVRDPLPKRAVAVLHALPWVADAKVRMREEGRLIFGEALVVPRSDERLTENIRDAVAAVRALDWRIHSFTITPVPALAAALPQSRDEAARPDRGAATRRPA